MDNKSKPQTSYSNRPAQPEGDDEFNPVKDNPKMERPVTKSKNQQSKSA